MNKVFMPILACLFLFAAAPWEDGSRRERVEFDGGANEATLEGQIRGYESVEYVLGAGAGQTMEVTLETSHGATYFNVFSPGTQPGRDAALFGGQTGGQRFEGKLPLPGDYVVQVYMMRSSARRNDVADYTLKVRIEGTPDSSVQPPEEGPWPVDTDASGELPCSSRDGELDLQCPFRVKRNSFGATLWVMRPGENRDPTAVRFDELRMLSFEKLDEAKFMSNDASEITWRRDDDKWIVAVGESERYGIPDAAIWGG